jgi:cytochrome P450
LGGVDSPLGATVTLDQLEHDPHPTLAKLREHEPVSWIPPLEGWLVTRYDLVLEAMRDPAAFTVDDPRFSTARVIGPSMLSLDGEQHARHRAPFVAPFRAGAVRERFAEAAADEADRLIDALKPLGAAELRRGFAGPLAAAIVTRALGQARDDVPLVLACYEQIVGAVTEITAGRGDGARGREAFARLGESLVHVIDSPGPDSLLAAAARGSGGLTDDEVVSNAAVLLFGGIETTEGMIANTVLYLLEQPERVQRIRDEPGLLDAAIEESLRLEPAAAVIDRYATAETQLGGADIGQGELVRLSIAAANRDPRVFESPDRFELTRSGARRHLAFAQGPHVCVGVHLARLETRVGIARLLERLPDLQLDPGHPATIRGLVFRKPPTLHVVWG